MLNWLRLDRTIDPSTGHAWRSSRTPPSECGRRGAQLRLRRKVITEFFSHVSRAPYTSNSPAFLLFIPQITCLRRGGLKICLPPSSSACLLNEPSLCCKYLHLSIWFAGCQARWTWFGNRFEDLLVFQPPKSSLLSKFPCLWKWLLSTNPGWAALPVVSHCSLMQGSGVSMIMLTGCVTFVKLFNPCDPYFPGQDCLRLVHRTTVCTFYRSCVREMLGLRLIRCIAILNQSWWLCKENIDIAC